MYSRETVVHMNTVPQPHRPFCKNLDNSKTTTPTPRISQTHPLA